MRKRFDVLRYFAIACLFGCSVPAYAKTVTMNDLTIELPDTFKVSDSKRGLKAQSSDKEVDLWVETYKDAEIDAIVEESTRYFAKNNVVTSDEPVRTQTTGPSQHDVEAYDYKDATWKGKPTVLRYLRIGPFGSENKRVLFTLWASPNGDSEHAKEIDAIVNSVDVVYVK